MTIASEDARSGPYTGNGSTTVFAYDYKVTDETHMVVTLTVTSTGVETVQTLTTDYTVSGVGSEGGGNVTMVTAPASGETLTLSRDVPLTQLTDLQNRGGVQPTVLETAYDKLTQIAQDQQEELDRSIKVPVSDNSGADFTLPAPTADTVIAIWDSAGTALIAGPTASSISGAEAEAAAAAASAVTAASEATAAAASAAEAKAVGTTASQIFVDGADFTAGSSTSLTFTAGTLVTDSRDVFTIFYDGVAQHNEPASVTGNTTDTTLTLSAAIPTGVTEVYAVANLRSVSIAVASDSTFSIQDDVDSTKIGAFQVSGVTTGTTRTLTWPDADGTISLIAGTETLTNKTIALGSNTVSGTLAQFNTAVTDATLVSTAGTETLTNKTIALGSNTVSGTLAQFNTAVTDATLVSLVGSETLTNKTLTSPTINTAAAGGTWTAASTWTLPAVTLGGTVTSNGQSFSGTIADLGTVTTADINGGTIDGAVIGGASAAAGTFTTFTSTGIDDNAASTALTIDSAGKVGIGTASPDSGTPLHVQESSASLGANPAASALLVERSGTVAMTLGTSNTGTASIFFGDPENLTGGRVQYDNSNNSLQFWANAAERMRISSSGAVLIGSAFTIEANYFYAANANGPMIMQEAASSTNPTLVPNRQDTDTGLGWVSADIGALVAGGTNVFEFSSSGPQATVRGELNIQSASGNDDLKFNTITSMSRSQSSGKLTISTNADNIEFTPAGGVVALSNAAGPALLNEAATSTNPTLVPNKATPATGMGASGSNTGYLISNGTEHIRWGFGGTVITGTLGSSGTHTVGTNSSGNSATLQQTNGFQFKLNGDTASQLGTVSWVNNSGATTANLWATGDSSSGGVVRLKGIGHIDLVPGDVGITGAAGYRHSTGVFTPPADNSQTLGSASLRWSTVYAGTGSINTSDERLKQQIKDLDTAELVVAKAIKGMVKKFKFNDAVAEKGDKARIHVGVIAQEVRDAFIAEGLDPTRYSLFCYDEWDEIKEETDEDGTVLVPARPAGNRFGIRYDELLAFIIAAI